jgi:hypothetical protein
VTHDEARVVQSPCFSGPTKPRLAWVARDVSEIFAAGTV